MPYEGEEEHYELYIQIKDAYEMALSFPAVHQLPPLEQALTLHSWARAVLPRLKIARDVHWQEAGVYQFYNSIVAMTEMLISRLNYRAIEQRRKEQEAKLTKDES